MVYQETGSSGVALLFASVGLFGSGVHIPASRGLVDGTCLAGTRNCGYLCRHGDYFEWTKDYQAELQSHSATCCGGNVGGTFKNGLETSL